MAKATTSTAPAAPALDVDFINSGLTVTAGNDLVKKLAQPKNKRSDAQVALDEKVPEIHAAWVKAGKPSAFAKIPTVSYPVHPTRASNMHGMIRKAADFHGLRARFGQDVVITPEVANALGLPDTQHGNVLVTFGIMDKSKSASNGDAPAEDSNDES